MVKFQAAVGLFPSHETAPASMGNCKTIGNFVQQNTLPLITERKQLALEFQGRRRPEREGRGGQDARSRRKTQRAASGRGGSAAWL